MDEGEMATGFKQPGSILDFVAPVGGFTSGTPALVGSLIVIPLVTGAEGVTVACQVDGVWNMPRATGGGSAWAVGDRLYFDSAAAKFTKTATGNKSAGIATKATVDGDAKGDIRLDGIGSDTGDEDAATTVALEMLTRRTATVGGKLVLPEGSNNGTNTMTVLGPDSLAANRTITLPDADVDLTTVPRYVKETATVGSKLELREGTDNGTNKVDFLAPNSIAANRTITLPDADLNLGRLVKETAGAPGELQLFEDTANGTNKVTVKPVAALAADRTVTLPDGDVDLTDIQAGSATKGILGTYLRFVADGNVIGGVPVVHVLNLVAAAGDNDIVITHKTRFFMFVPIKTDEAGLAGGTLTMKNGATAITDAMVWDNTVADKTIKNFATIDDAQWEIAAGGTLRGTTSQAQSRGKVFCVGYRVA